jgi:hypothetical protein
MAQESMAYSLPYLGLLYQPIVQAIRDIGYYPGIWTGMHWEGGEPYASILHRDLAAVSAAIAAASVTGIVETYAESILKLLQPGGSPPVAVAAAANAALQAIDVYKPTLLDKMGWQQIKGTWDWYVEQLGKPDVGGGGVLARAGAAFAAQTTIGLAASAVADLSGLDVLGCWDVPLNNLAGFLGKMAGWDKTFAALQGPFFSAWLEVPWDHYCQRTFRPTHPARADVLSWWTKRLMIPAAATPIPGVAVEETRALQVAGAKAKRDNWLAEAGYANDLIELMVEDSWKVPRLFELLTMMEDANLSDATLGKQLRRMSFRDEDVLTLMDAAKRRLARSELNRILTTVLDALADGFMTEETARAWLHEYKFPSVRSGAAVQAALIERDTRRLKRRRDTLILQYQRDQITDQELSDQLGVIYPEVPEFTTELISARMSRTHKVYLLTPTEITKTAWSAARQLFRTWKMTETDLWAIFVAGGMDPDVADMEVAAEQTRRPIPKVAAEPKEVQVSASTLRQLFMLGQLTVGELDARLVTLGWSRNAIDAEIQLDLELLRRRQQQRTERYNLAPYEEAYVLDLIDWTTLLTAMVDAGLSYSEQTARRVVLDYKRDQHRAKEAEAQEAAEWAALEEAGLA